MIRPIALLTDFGWKDHYVGSLKSVILGINPKAVMFDVTHDIRAQNIREGAFVLNSVYPVLPKGTIVVAVIDPGVGSMRQALCVKTTHGFLLAPNNGLLTLVLAGERRYEARAITNDKYFRKPVSATFHGRDIFAPCAAHLSVKDIFRMLGPRIKRPHMLDVPKAVHKEASIHGEVIHIDRFGNAVTNISSAELSNSKGIESASIAVKGNKKVRMKPFFSAGHEGELIAVWNSGNLLEFAVKNDSAARLYRLKLGDPVRIQCSK